MTVNPMPSISIPKEPSMNSCLKKVTCDSSQNQEEQSLAGTFASCAETRAAGAGSASQNLRTGTRRQKAENTFDKLPRGIEAASYSSGMVARQLGMKHPKARLKHPHATMKPASIPIRKTYCGLGGRRRAQGVAAGEKVGSEAGTSAPVSEPMKALTMQMHAGRGCDP